MSNESAADLERFFDQMTDRFASVTKNSGRNVASYSIANQRIRIQIAGEALAHLTRALAHQLVTEYKVGSVRESSLSLDLLVWSDSLQAPLPEAPWAGNQAWYLGEIPQIQSERFLINFHSPSSLLCMMDKATARAIYWLPNAEALPFWELGSPFRVILHWWAQTIGGHLVHAAAVGFNGSGVLLAGRGGSGKSTLAMTCLDAGMEYVGDDYVLLMRNSHPKAASVYNSAKLHTSFLQQAMPHWSRHVATEIGPEQKSLFFLEKSASNRLKESLDILAVVLPRVHPKEAATLSKRPMADGLLALAPSTIFQLPGARETALPFLKRWMNGLPVFGIETGHDLSAAPLKLEGLISSLEPIH